LGQIFFLIFPFRKSLVCGVIVPFRVHVSNAYVTICLITEEYNFGFAVFDISLL
jgi:hypothetical protein